MLWRSLWLITMSVSFLKILFITIQLQVTNEQQGLNSTIATRHLHTTKTMPQTPNLMEEFMVDNHAGVIQGLNSTMVMWYLL